MRFEVDERAYHEYTQTPAGDIWKWLNRGNIREVYAAKRQVGVKTGKLRSSIQAAIVPSPRGPIAIVGSANNIALLHHEGSKEHRITPRNAKILRFPWHGRIVYTYMVRHPGTNPNRYLTDNIIKAYQIEP